MLYDHHCVDGDVFDHRDPEERLVRRERLAHLVLPDPPVLVDLLEMTVLKETPYVPSTECTHQSPEH